MSSTMLSSEISSREQLLSSSSMSVTNGTQFFCLLGSLFFRAGDTLGDFIGRSRRTDFVASENRRYLTPRILNFTRRSRQSTKIAISCTWRTWRFSPSASQAFVREKKIDRFYEQISPHVHSVTTHDNETKR